jgi:hypothetical protein
MYMELFGNNVISFPKWGCYVCNAIKMDNLTDNVRPNGDIPATAGQEKGHDVNRSLFSPTLDRVKVLDDAPRHKQCSLTILRISGRNANFLADKFRPGYLCPVAQSGVKIFCW